MDLNLGFGLLWHDLKALDIQGPASLQAASSISLDLVSANHFISYLERFGMAD